MSQCVHKSYERSSANLKIELDLSNYSKKADLKEATGVDTSNLAAKLHLTVLKTQVDKIDTDKLKNLPAYLSKLSNTVENNVVTETIYGKLVTKINARDNKISCTSGLILNSQYN